MSFQRTMVCLRKAHIRIPMLSPTHTRAKIVRWCLETPNGSALPQPTEVESYDPLFVLQCSPDLVTEGYRQHETHEPKMIVEVHDEGRLTIHEGIQMNQWYPVGTEIGEINDEDEDSGEDGEWLWQAYSYSDDDDADGAGKSLESK